MKNKLMLGLWRYIINGPPFLWQKQIAQGKRKFEKEHGAMSEEKRLIHHFVVRELPSNGKPLSPERISDKLGFSVDRSRSWWGSAGHDSLSFKPSISQGGIKGHQKRG